MNESLFLFLNGLAGKSDLFDAIILFFAQYAIYVLVLAAVVFIFKSKDDISKKLIIIFGGAALAWIISQGINVVFPIARPFLSIPGVTLLFEHGSGLDSFPSGHATFAFALALGFFYLNKPLAWLFILSALLIGVSRVVAGVHSPLDILGGFVLAGITILVVHYLLQKSK